MVLKLRQSDPTRLHRAKVKRTLKRARARFMSERKGDVSDLRQRILNLFRATFENLGRKRFTWKPIHSMDVPLVEGYNEDLEDIGEDLQVLYEEAKRIRELQQLTFNYNAVLTEQLTNRAAEATSQVIDLRLLAGQLREEVVVAGDDFNNASRIDGSFSLDNPQAEVVQGQGIITLQRTSYDTAVDEDTEVEVNPLTPGMSRNASERNLKRFYEGHFHAYIGKARPEGGKFNLEEKVRVEVADEIEGTEYTLLSIVPGSSTASQWFNSGDPNDYENAFKDLRESDEETREGQVLRPNDIIVIDRGASEEEKAAARKAIVDGNPDTIWECEYAIPSTVGPYWRDRVEYIEKRLITLKENPSTSTATIAAWERELEITKGIVEKTKTQEYLSAEDRLDMDVEVILRLPEGRQEIVNFLTLNPVHFDAAWLQVLEISTAASEDSPWLPIEGFDQGLFENTLTDEANEELEEGNYKATLAPTRYAYRGQGVWTFPGRKVTKIRFTIRQAALIPSPYQVMNIHLRRSITRSVGNWAVIRDDTRVVELDYLQTVQAMDDLNFRNELAGETSGGSSSGSQSNTTSAKWYYYVFAGLFGGGPTTSNYSTSHNDSGWQVTRTWLETKWDIIRYAIGIRDIGAFGYIFAPSSELVSVPFTSPKEVLKVQVRVDEVIPEALSIDQQWIEYYISADNGKEWLRINPLDHPTVFGDDGRIIPYTYTFNLEVEGPQRDDVRTQRTEKPVRQIRFKAVLKTDATIEDGSRITPVLKSYRVLITPKGSLSDAGF